MLKVHSLSYQTGKKYLIKNISLEFTPGFIYGIIGPNGSGKTTFLKFLQESGKLPQDIFFGMMRICSLLIDKLSVERFH